MIDNGFNIQNNKAGLNVSGGALVQTGTLKVFTAAEVRPFEIIGSRFSDSGRLTWQNIYPSPQL